MRLLALRHDLEGERFRVGNGNDVARLDLIEVFNGLAGRDLERLAVLPLRVTLRVCASTATTVARASVDSLLVSGLSAGRHSAGSARAARNSTQRFRMDMVVPL
ncbi:MAG: hypothetical protein WDO56_18460 [Gammaproteobacteria bacterium]